jgi:hypothetical protein
MPGGTRVLGLDDRLDPLVGRRPRSDPDEPLIYQSDGEWRVRVRVRPCSATRAGWDG